MKLISYNKSGKISLGVFEDDMIYDLHKLNSNIADNMLDFIKGGQKQLALARNVINNFKPTIQKSEISIVSPIINPPSIRDAYAFRQHVSTARKNRGLDMIPEFDEIPIFYFTNHHAIFGEGDFPVREKHTDKLDFELECAAVIGKKGRNISVSEADDYIFGFMIMNDFSARGLQMKEMKLNLGPAKGKDFATSFGPYIITKDKLKNKRIETEFGYKYDLNMSAFINNKKVSEDNSKNMHWTFAQIISHISIGTTLYPGDVIGSGTCATGCLLEINLTKKTDRWLKLNDIVTLKIEGLGELKNKIKMENINE